MKILTLPLRKENPFVTLTACLQEEPSPFAGRKRPAVVVCPGGGYTFCSSREAEPVAFRFAAMGYHVFVLRYSVYADDENMPMGSAVVPKPERVHPAPLVDLGSAFLTIRAHADEWGVDADRIAVCGFSAGAHNCAMYSVYWNAPLLTERLHAPAEQLRPAAAILGYAVTDQILMRDSVFKDPFEKELHAGFNVAFFGTAKPSEEQLLEASPARHVGAHTPPTFLWATSADSLVPVENSTRMASALAKAGVPFEIHVFEDVMHGLSLADQSTADSLMGVNENAAKWIPLCEKWLLKRFGLSIPEKPFWMQ